VYIKQEEGLFSYTLLRGGIGGVEGLRIRFLGNGEMGNS
jgi:hypothetical protein